MFTFWLALALCSPELTTTTTGTAVGVNYSVTASGFENTSFEISSNEFTYSSSPWLGHSTFQVGINKGRLSVNGKDRGLVNGGDQLIVTSDHEINVNGRAVR